MPHVVNGIGTWYYGKDNRHFHTSTCEHCGAHGHLASYDTTLYFTFLFVPLVPLGRKRVVDDCPRCHRHRVVKLKDWVSARHLDIRTAVEALRENPGDADRALHALGLAVAYQHRESYDVIRMLACGSLAGHAAVQAALASAGSYFGQLKEAEEAFRSSLAIEDNEEVRESLAVNLMRQNRPAEAAPLIDHVFSGATPERCGLVSLLAMSHQAEGAHEAALDVLDRAEKQWPSLAQDKELARLRKVSLKHRDHARKVPAPLLAPPPKSDEGETGRRSSRLARVVGPAVIVLLVAWYLGAAYLTGHRRIVHLVNGTAVAYEVAIDDRTYQLHPLHRKEVEIAEGQLTIEVRHPGVETGKETIRIETGFFSRPFVSREFVINPDRTAILVHEEATYSERPDPRAEDGIWSPSVGELLYTFEDVDYPFREFPEQITLSSGTSVRKSRIFVYQEGPRRAFMVAAMQGKEAASEYLKDSLAYNPASDEHLALLEAVLPADQIVSFARTRLEDRPVRVEWHRLYQRMMEIAEPEHDLEKEYALLLDRNPEDSALQYLMGRITRDPARAEQLFARSTRGAQPCAAGHAALAFRRLGSGRFDEALAHVREALALAPDHAGFRELESQVLLALGRYGDLLAANATARKAEPFDLELAARRIDLLVHQGDAQRAREVIDQHCETLKNGGADARMVESARTYLTGMYHYRLGQERSAGDLLAQLDEAGTDWQAALCQSRTADASRIVTESEDRDFATHLLIYISARLEGDTTLADRHLEAGVRQLASQGYEERRVAAWLSGETEAPAREVNDLVMRVDHKRIVLTALGLRFPREKKAYFALAARLNYDTAFPHHLLKRAHEFPG